VLVGNGKFHREQTIEAAERIAAASVRRQSSRPSS
jgi:hypothetical protein